MTRVQKTRRYGERRLVIDIVGGFGRKIDKQAVGLGGVVCGIWNTIQAQLLHYIACDQKSSVLNYVTTVNLEENG